MSEDTADNTSTGLPIIDLSLDEKTVATNVRKACLDSGFFYLTNHGISQHQIAKVFEMSKNFFALSVENKQECTGCGVQANKGYRGLGVETLDQKKQKQGGSKESYHVGHEESEIGEPGKELPNSGNLWPDSQLMPGFRETMLAYFAAMIELGERIMRVLAMALELEADFFKPYVTDKASILRLLHYTDTKSSVEDGIYACGEHTDYGFLTMLVTDDVPGLQICMRDGWLMVEPVQDAFIVNIGDILQRWTNGLFSSTLHRVLNVTGQERYSVPFFFDINFNTVVECLPTCCSESNPAKYPPITYGDHLARKIAEAYEKKS